MCNSFGQNLEFFEANGFDISISELKITFGIQKLRLMQILKTF